MAQPSINPNDFPPDMDQRFSADLDDRVVLLPLPEACDPTELPEERVEGMIAGPSLRARTHALRQVVVLDFAGPLHGAIQDLDLSIQHALADGPRGVVCDMSAVYEGAEPAAVELLATAGRHAADCPRIPVLLAGTTRPTRTAVTEHPPARDLMVSTAAGRAGPDMRGPAAPGL